MSDLNSNKNKHLTLDDRIDIQECLDKGMSYKAIGRRVGKDPTTISKEIKKHLCITPADNIRQTNQDGDFIPEVCPLLIRAPFVCNPCRKRRHYCGFQKQVYRAKNAQSEYESLLSEAREGIPLNSEEFYEVDRIVSEGVKKGQHLYHIMETNDLGVSKSTVYRHLNRGYLSVSTLDFPRVVKFKQRKPKKEDYIPKSAKAGRTYDDFLAYIDENNINSWVEMDTVIGRIGGKAIMTLDFTFCNFMIGLLLEYKTSFEVTQKITLLKSVLAKNKLCFGDIIPLAITDNGGEFANIFAIENNIKGEKETSLYFCDPYKSCQKPKVEKNHTLFRDIVSKGESFDSFTQDSVNLIFSHINSVKRKVFNGKSPYEMFAFTYGENASKILGIEPIQPEKVIQSPKLLEKILKH